MTRPSRRSVATFRWVEGCVHIFVCIAGATITGPRAHSESAVTEIVGATRAQARQNIRRRRSDEHQVDVARDLHMRFARVPGIEHVGTTGAPQIPDKVSAPKKGWPTGHHRRDRDALARSWRATSAAL